MTGHPKETLQERLAARQAELAKWTGQDRRLALLRLGLALAVLVAAGLNLGGIVDFAWAWLWIPATVFALFVWWHANVASRVRSFRHSVAFYQGGLDRMADRWAGKGLGGEEFMPERHPFAVDLDLFGEGSLYERLCSARTQAGQATLASWLLTPGTPEAVAERQLAVRELRESLTLREELYRLADAVRLEVSPARLAAWGNAPSPVRHWWLRLVAPVLVLFTLVSLLGLSNGWFGGMWLICALALQGAFGAMLHKSTAFVREGEYLARDLDVLSRMLERLSREPMSATLLQRLQQQIRTEGRSPAATVRSLARRLEMLEASRNQIFAVISPLLLWGTQWGLAIEAWRVRFGPSLSPWLAAAGELEAILSLAGYAFESPSSVFPEVVAEGPPQLEAQELGHPLLPDDHCVRNDLSLHETEPLLIVSGSNMSGKSTFLRTVGCGIVMALAGAPVRARSLRLTPLSVGASIRVMDSLREGTSRFYAEIIRLRDILEQAALEPPTCFLLDEILHGTNSHDRRVGTEAVLKALAQRGAVGLVTTHDLALSDIAASIPGAGNVHFADDVVDGEMVFDYRKRQGVVERSNALRLMQSLGLPV